MDTNTAILDLNEYYKLRQLKENVDKDMVIFNVAYNGFYQFYTVDEHLKNMAARTVELNREIDRLNNIIPKDIFKQTSLLQFIKKKYLSK